MGNLNDIILRKYTEDITQKGIRAIDAPELVLQFIEYEKLNHSLLHSTSAYELANSLRSYKFWYDKRNIEPPKFKPNARDVYYVDLGAFNIKYEEGFIHPCLVVKSYGDKALVVPGSTKKYGKGGFLIEDITLGDGFTNNTGLLIDQLRCVSVTRFKGKKLGRVSPETFKKIEDKVFQAFLQNKYSKFEELEKEKQQLICDKEVLNQKIQKLNEELVAIKSTIEAPNT